MLVGYVKSNDRRTPYSDVVLQKLVTAGHEIMIDESLGHDKYQAIKNEVLSKADFIISSAPLEFGDYKEVKKGAHIISIFESYRPGFDLGSIAVEAAKVYSLDMIPRSTLAQSVDVLSSMASLSGYSAVLLAATMLPRQIPMMMTAAGTIKPANALILGAGVAGLQAVATAKRLGARVEVFDVRSAVKEEVQSLGAKFVEVEGAKDDKDAGGYAVQQTDDYKQKQKDAIARSVAKADIVITTAQLRGKPAPILITDEMVSHMRVGSVIIDLASATGGNVEGVVDKSTTTIHGVQVLGDSELYLQTVVDASALLANNFFNYLSFFKFEDGQIFDDHDILQASKISG